MEEEERKKERKKEQERERKREKEEELLDLLRSCCGCVRLTPNSFLEEEDREREERKRKKERGEGKREIAQISAGISAIPYSVCSRQAGGSSPPPLAAREQPTVR